MQIKLNGEPIGSLERFFATNADGIGETEAADIRTTLARGETYHGGGGAVPEWTLAPLPVRRWLRVPEAA